MSRRRLTNEKIQRVLLKLFRRIRNEKFDQPPPFYVGEWDPGVRWNTDEVPERLRIALRYKNALSESTLCRFRGMLSWMIQSGKLRVVDHKPRGDQLIKFV